MKKFLATLLVAMMLVSLCAVQVSADSKVVYVGAGNVWEEKGTGTKDDPYSKLSMAIKALAATGGEIILVDNIDLFYEYTNDVSEGEPNPSELGNTGETGYPFHLLNPVHTGKIIIKSESADDIKSIKFAGVRHQTSWTMNGPTEFQNVTLDFSSGTYRRVYSNGYDVVFGDGVTSNGTYMYPGLSPYTTEEDKIGRIVKVSSIVIKDGNWNYLFGAQATNCGDDLVTNYYVTGKANIAGYACPGPMNSLSFKEANLYVDTTAGITTLHNGYSSKNGAINVYVKNGTIGTVSLKPLGGGENTSFTLNILGGSIGTVTPYTPAEDETNTLAINAASGVTAPTVSGITVGTAASADFAVKSYVGATPVLGEVKATLKTTAEIKPNTDVVFTVEGIKEGGIAIFKKGYDLSFTDTEVDPENGDETTDYDPAFKYPKLDEEGNIQVNDKGEEQYAQYVYGSPLMKGAVVDGKATLNKDSAGVIKSINDAEYAELEGLAVGEYVAYFYAPGASEAAASVEFLVTENPKVVEEPSKPSVDTGDEVIWIVLATLVSAMAAAVVYNKKRI